MTKVSIKPDPTFRVEVEIPRPGKEALKLPLLYKHRGKAELEEFRKTDPGRLREDIDVVMDMVEGWEANEEFNREAMAGLLNNFHAAGDAIVGAYISELRRARSGN